MLTQDYTKVVSNLLAGNSAYTPNYLYVEYTNSDVPAAPTDTAGKEYYDGLSAPLGYFRVPITIKPTVSANNKITYTVLLPADMATNNAIVYGVALVSAPDPGDSTHDIVFAREYFVDKPLALSSNQTLCFSFQLAVFGAEDVYNDDFWNEE